jgi:hypothetical protein
METVNFPNVKNERKKKEKEVLEIHFSSEKKKNIFIIIKNIESKCTILCSTFTTQNFRLLFK